MAAYNLRPDLPHLRILTSYTDPDGSTITSPGGGRFALGTIYLAEVDYSQGGFQNNDKPRVDFNRTSFQSLFPSTVEWWMGIAVYLPSDYEADTVQAREEIVQLHSPNGGATNNHAQFNIFGDASSGRNAPYTGAEWVMQCNRNSDNGFYVRTPILRRHLGQWTFHVFNFRLDAPTAVNAVQSSAIAKMKYWLTEQDTPATATYNENIGTRFGTYVSGAMDPIIQPSTHCVYKGNWRSPPDNTYTGTKSDPISVGITHFRMGKAVDGCGYRDVHPLQWAQP
jgi:hypothetical protein